MNKIKCYPSEYNSLQDFLLHCNRRGPKKQIQSEAAEKIIDQSPVKESFNEFKFSLCVKQRPSCDEKPPESSERYFYERNSNTPLPSELPLPDKINYT